SAFARLDARLAHPLPLGLELVLGADNPLDAHARGWPGATQRHMYAGLHWRMARGAASPADGDHEGARPPRPHPEAPAQPEAAGPASLGHSTTNRSSRDPLHAHAPPSI